MGSLADIPWIYATLYSIFPAARCFNLCSSSHTKKCCSNNALVFGGNHTSCLSSAAQCKSLYSADFICVCICIYIVQTQEPPNNAAHHLLLLTTEHLPLPLATETCMRSRGLEGRETVLPRELRRGSSCGRTISRLRLSSTRHHPRRCRTRGHREKILCGGAARREFSPCAHPHQKKILIASFYAPPCNTLLVY